MLLLCAASSGGCGSDAPDETAAPRAAVSLEERLQAASAALALGDGTAAWDAYHAINLDFPGSVEARFGRALADELLLLEALDDLLAAFLNELETGTRPDAAPVDAGALIVDALQNRMEPAVRDALEQLEICRQAPDLRFPLDRLPYRILGTELLILSGEVDAGDVLLHQAGLHLTAAALDTALSLDLDFDFGIVERHAPLWGGMEAVETVHDAVDMLLEIVSDPHHPAFLCLRPDEGPARMPRAALNLAAFLDLRVLGFQAVRREPVSGIRQATGCNDRDASGTCDPGEFVHGFLWSLPAELHDLLSGVRLAMRDSFLDGTPADPDPAAASPFRLDRLNPVLAYLGSSVTLPPLGLDLGGAYARPDPAGVQGPVRIILFLVRLLVDAVAPLPEKTGPVGGALPVPDEPRGAWSLPLSKGDGLPRALRARGPDPAGHDAAARAANASTPASSGTAGARSAASPSARLPQGPPPVGWETVAGIAALPFLRPGARTLQTSSHDPEGGNDDGFTPPNELYVDEHGEFVLFDAFGPGCIYRMWFTHTWSLFSNLRVYVDDMERPAAEGPFLLLFASVFEPFTAPLAGNWLSASGGCFSYVPVPFEKRCKITGSLPPEFFQFTWVRYDADTPVSSFTGAEDLSVIREQWERAGEDPKPVPPDLSTHTGRATLGPGEAAVLLDRAGPGAVWRLFLRGDVLRQEAARDLWLVARWDDHPSPDVEAPVNEFFGCFFVEDAPAGLLMGRLEDRLYCYFPMPMRTRGEILLENRGGRMAGVSWELAVAEGAYGPGAGSFRAVHRSEDPVTPGRDYRIGERQGRAGQWLGLTHTMRGPRSRGYLEGDERLYVDGSASPAVHGTGTEDYYNGGWYFLMGPFAGPLFGNPSHRVFPAYDQTGAFRLHLGDAVHYLNGVRLGIEHGGFDEGTADAYSSVAYFYETDAPRSVPCDALDVGDPAGEAGHGYRAEGSSLTAELTSFFEGEDDPVPLSDTGRVLGQAGSRFRLHLAPGNQGVVLRRRYDQFRGGQAAEVRVDGRTAGTWYAPESSPSLRWAEDDFVLPASLTAGRGGIEVSIHPRGPVPWTEFHYRADCILPPDAR